MPHVYDIQVPQLLTTDYHWPLTTGDWWPLPLPNCPDLGQGNEAVNSTALPVLLSYVLCRYNRIYPWLFGHNSLPKSLYVIYTCSPWSFHSIVALRQCSGFFFNDTGCWCLISWQYRMSVGAKQRKVTVIIACFICCFTQFCVNVSQGKYFLEVFLGSM